MSTIAFIAGSGSRQSIEGLLQTATFYDGKENRFGKISPYVLGRFGSTDVIVLARHGVDESSRRTPAELTRTRGWEANMWALRVLEAKAIYAVSAVGSLDRAVPLASEGALIVPRDYLRGFAASQHSYGTHALIPQLTPHPNMSHPFHPLLRRRAKRAIREAGYTALDGLYIFQGGDQFETRSEIKVLDALTKGMRNRLVGMTVVPEAILAAQLGIPYVALCANVNYAEGLCVETKVSHGQTSKEMHAAETMVAAVARRIILAHGTDGSQSF